MRKAEKQISTVYLTYPVVWGWISPGRLAALYRLLADLLRLLAWINRKQEKWLKSGFKFPTEKCKLVEWADKK